MLLECGLETLESRCDLKKLVLIFKIQNNFAPQYLCDICPRNIRVISNYGLRNIKNIQTPISHKNYYLNFVFPSTVRNWNNLSLDIRSSLSVATFKSKLNKNSQIYFWKICLFRFGSSAIMHSRLRMRLSGL